MPPLSEANFKVNSNLEYKTTLYNIEENRGEFLEREKTA
jgi:hypothetical protein